MDNTSRATSSPDPTVRVSWHERIRLDMALVPTVAVMAVAIASLTAAVMLSRHQSVHDMRPDVSLAFMQSTVKAPSAVVKAPPLRSPQRLAQAQRQAGAPATNSAGAGPGCRNCGYVESVASLRPRSYQLRVRMDDGSVKSIEQRAAFPAGTRVVLEAGMLKAAPDNG